jgi:tetratricopeptide (TPR) repeat protein
MVTRDYASARAILEESVTLCRQVGDNFGVGMSLRDLGQLARLEGDYDRAAVLYGESLALLRAVGQRSNVGRTLVGIGYLARQQKNPGRARAAFVECLSLMREDGSLRGFRSSHHALGELERSLGNFDEAASYLKGALSELKKIGWIQFAWPYLYSLGTLLLQRGSHARGLRLAAAVPLVELDPVNNLPDDIVDHDDAVQVARGALGEAAFAAAWAEGHAMTLEQAVSYALEEEKG